MNTYIPLVLTAIVTVSTIIYTFYSIQLWRTTRVEAEISRQAAFSNLWAELNRYLEILREQKRSRNRFSRKILQFAAGIHDQRSDDARCIKGRPRLRRFSPKSFKISCRERSRRIESSLDPTAGSAQESLACGRKKGVSQQTLTD